MTDTKTLTFQRRLAARSARVHDTLIDPKARMIWGPPSADTVVLIDEDQPVPAPGVRELSRCGPSDNPYVMVLTDWIMIRPERIVYAETIEAEGAPLGTTLAIYDLDEAGGETALQVTLMVAGYVGKEAMAEFEEGWTHALANLAAFVEQMPA